MRNRGVLTIAPKSAKGGATDGRVNDRVVRYQSPVNGKIYVLHSPSAAPPPPPPPPPPPLPPPQTAPPLPARPDRDVRRANAAHPHPRRNAERESRTQATTQNEYTTTGFDIHQRIVSSEIPNRNGLLEQTLTRVSQSNKRYPNPQDDAVAEQKPVRKAVEVKKYQRFMRDYEPEWTTHNWNLAFGQRPNRNSNTTGMGNGREHLSRQNSTITVAKSAVPDSNVSIVSNTKHRSHSHGRVSAALATNSGIPHKQTALIQAAQADLLRDPLTDVSALGNMKRYTSVSTDASTPPLLITKVRSRSAHKTNGGVNTMFRYPPGQTVEITAMQQNFQTPLSAPKPQEKQRDVPIEEINENFVANPVVASPGRYLEIEKIQFSRDHATPEFGDVAEPEFGMLRQRSKHSLPSAALRKILQRKTTNNSATNDFDSSFARIYGTSVSDRGRWNDKGWIIQDRTYGGDRVYSASYSGIMTPRSTSIISNPGTVRSIGINNSASSIPSVPPTPSNLEAAPGSNHNHTTPSEPTSVAMTTHNATETSMTHSVSRRALNVKAFYPSYVNVQVAEQQQQQQQQEAKQPESEESSDLHPFYRHFESRETHSPQYGAPMEPSAIAALKQHFRNEPVDQSRVQFNGNGNVARVAVSYDVIVGESVVI